MCVYTCERESKKWTEKFTYSYSPVDQMLKMSLSRQIGCEKGSWVRLVQDRIQLRSLAKMVVRNLDTRRANRRIINLSGKILLPGDTYAVYLFYSNPNGEFQCNFFLCARICSFHLNLWPHKCRAGLRGGPAGQLFGAPTCKGCKDVTGITGNMVQETLRFSTLKITMKIIRSLGTRP